MTGSSRRPLEARSVRSAIEAGRLGPLVTSARIGAERREREVPRAALERRASSRTPRGDAFLAAIGRPGRVNVIAECKRRSPSRGVLRVDYEAGAIASAYTRGGASAVSVLTDEGGFGGSLADLAAARAATSLPLLQKDFIVSDYQVVEARSAGADAVLLIVAVLDPGLLARLLATARAHGLAALVEVHDEDELARAIDAGARIVGVNSRDLRTFEVDLGTAERLAGVLPRDVVGVAESGIRTPEDLRALLRVGFRAFLVGEALVGHPDPGATLAAWLAEIGPTEPDHVAERRPVGEAW